MSIVARTYNRLIALFGAMPKSKSNPDDAETRRLLFEGNRRLYEGTIYSRTDRGGYLRNVLEAYVGPAYCDENKYPIYPFFMPFREIVDTYQNIWRPGNFSGDLRPSDEFDGNPINPKLPPALQKVWRDSNLATEKSKIIRWAANCGTVGIRIVGERENGERKARAVLMADDPSHLFNFEEDSRGNATAVVLKFKKSVNKGTLADPDWQEIDVVEEITEEGFSRLYDGVEQIADADRKNTFGFNPYVILRHKDNGSAWGDWAYLGSEAAIHRINFRISRQDTSIDRHQFPKWFGAGAGDKPQTHDMGDTSMTWVKLMPDGPNPLLQAIVADIDQSAAQAFWLALRDELRGRQPELNLNDVKLLSNTSGESLAQALLPTKQAIEAVKPNYDHALIRAMQMATSVGVAFGAWDVGTGTGEDAANRAYREGYENFEFVPREPLPETPQQQLVKAQASVAERQSKFALATAAAKIVPDAEEVLKLAGYDEKEAKRLAASAQSNTGTQPNQGRNSDRVNRIIAGLP